MDIAIRFLEEMDAHEKFHCRSRIETKLQEYTDNLVDVSDIDSLPITTAYTVFRDGTTIAGDTSEIEAYRAQVEQEYFATKDERKQARRDFIHKLAKKFRLGTTKISTGFLETGV